VRGGTGSSPDFSEAGGFLVEEMMRDALTVDVWRGDGGTGRDALTMDPCFA
jgi:hypothetical protein